MSKIIASKKTSSREKISHEVTLELWVKAGGRCQLHGCNQYLLEDEFTGINPLNLADKAHIVAHSKNGPRGKNKLSVTERNKADNLMLLCPRCHNKIIDKKKNIKEFSTDRLMKDKSEHEKRIYFLTSIQPGHETTIIRLRSKIRRENVEIPTEQIREAILKGAGRYPRYPLGRDDIEIDLTHLSETGTYWEAGKAKIAEVMDRLCNSGFGTGSIQHASVFALARIPFLICLGSNLTDKIPTDIYQKHRNDGESWVWPKDEKGYNFETNLIRSGTRTDSIVLILSISGKLQLDNILNCIDDSYAVYEILPKGIPPDRSVISSKVSLNFFRDTYQKFLRHVEGKYKGLGKIKLFPAIPLSAAIICGRELLKDISPAIEIYDKIEENFVLTMEVRK